MAEIVHVINHSIMITFFVFVMKLFINYMNVLTNGKKEKAVKGGRERQYTIAFLLGSIPSCLEACLMEL